MLPVTRTDEQHAKQLMCDEVGRISFAASFFRRTGETEGAQLRGAEIRGAVLRGAEISGAVNATVRHFEEALADGPTWHAVRLAFELGYWEARLERLPDARRRLFVAREDWKPRQRSVLRLVLNGFSDKEIAARLRVSKQRVKQHVAAIAAKCDGTSGSPRQRILAAADGRTAFQNRVVGP